MKPIIRNLLLVLLGLALVGAFGYFGLHAYRNVREARLLRQARAYLEKNDTLNAALLIQRALRAQPKNPEACSLMADLLESGNSRAALLWRSKAAEYAPRSDQNRLALVQTALALHDYSTATNALEHVSEAGKKKANYQNLAGTLAVVGHRVEQAEVFFAEAARLDPQNPVPQMNLAVLRLLSTNEQSQADARSSLDALSSNRTNGVVRCKALRELVQDAARHHQPTTALALFDRLLQETNSQFSDRLLRLEILQMTTNASFTSALEEYQREAASNPASISELAVWQFSKFGPTNTLTWLRTLPVSVQTNGTVALMEAECLDLVGEWPTLQTWLQKQNWGDMEFMRHAFTCRAMRQQELLDSSKAEWEQAFKVANDQSASLAMLLQMAAKWNMGNEAEDILWAFVNRYPSERWASTQLMQFLYASGRTRQIMTLSNQQAKNNPGDLSAKNNLAVTALLLSAQELNPHDLAREVYQKSPTNASFASTYAFSLYLQKKNSEALQVIEKLDSNTLEDPSIAGYYALILKATGNQAKAQTYFQTAFKSPLLPEERKLFEKASAS